MVSCFSYTLFAVFSNGNIHVDHAVYKSSSILVINKVYLPKIHCVTYELRLATNRITWQNMRIQTLKTI